MEAADCLYGVSMAGNGVSKVISAPACRARWTRPRGLTWIHRPARAEAPTATDRGASTTATDRGDGGADGTGARPGRTPRPASGSPHRRVERVPRHLLPRRAPTSPTAPAERTRSVGRDVRRGRCSRTLNLIADRGARAADAGDLRAAQLERGQRRLNEARTAAEVAERSTSRGGAILADEAPLTRHELAAGCASAASRSNRRARRRSTSSAAPRCAGVLCRGRRPRARGALPAASTPARCPTATAPSPSSRAATPPPTRAATAEDFATWSGLPGRRRPPRLGRAEPPAGEPPEGPVRLLPAFDEWLLGWASRDPSSRGAARAASRLRGGIIRPVAIADGPSPRTCGLDRAASLVDQLEPRSTRSRAPGCTAAGCRGRGHGLGARGRLRALD